METSVRESKASLRLRMKRLRESLSRDQVEFLGHEIARRLSDSSLLVLPAAIALYASVHNEVATKEVFIRLRQKGCRTLFPRLAGDGLEFVEADDWNRLVPGRWGVPEPTGRNVVPLSEIAAVLVPGLAFDEDGGRLGFGKGYFDAALESYEGLKIGLAYDFQVLPAIPRTESDLVCDWIVTETRVVRGASRKERTWNPSPS